MDNNEKIQRSRHIFRAHECISKNGGPSNPNEFVRILLS